MKLRKFFLIIILPLVFFSFKGCILDSVDIETIVQTFPLTYDVDIQTDGLKPFEKEMEFELENISYINKYKNELEDIRIVSVTFRTIKNEPKDLEADIYFYFKDGEKVLLQRFYDDLKLSDYTDKDLNFELTQKEIESISRYLEKINNKTIYAKLIVDNVVSAGKPVDVQGTFTVDVEMKHDKK